MQRSLFSNEENEEIKIGCVQLYAEPGRVEANVKKMLGYGYLKYVSPIYEGDIDYGKLIESLKEVSYEEGFCIEDESLRSFPMKEWPRILRRDVEFLEGILKQFGEEPKR